MSAEDIDRLLTQIRDYERLLGVRKANEKTDQHESPSKHNHLTESHNKIFGGEAAPEIVRYHELPESDRKNQKLTNKQMQRASSYTIIPKPEEALQAIDIDAILEMVTFIRLSLHKIVWHNGRFCDGNRNATQRFAPAGRLTIQYTFPLRRLTNSKNDDLRSEVEYQQKKHSAVVKATLPDKWTINARKVFTITIDEDLKQSWKDDSMTFRIICTNDKIASRTRQLGVAFLPMKCLFELPCALDASVPIFPSYFSKHPIGQLELSVQLGSRTPHVNEQLERMRELTQHQQIHAIGQESNQEPKQRRQSTSDYEFGSIDQQREDTDISTLYTHAQSNLSDDAHKKNPLHQSKIEFFKAPMKRLPSHHLRHEARNQAASLTPRVDIDAYNEAQRRRREKHVLIQTPPDNRNDDEYSVSPVEYYSPQKQRKNNGVRTQRQYFRVVVHEAQNLPLVKSMDPRLPSPQLPNTFVTYRANNEKLMRSPIVYSSRSPVWNWTSVVELATDRKNIVFKLWHRTVMGAESALRQQDRVLGFVTIDLKQDMSLSGFYDLTDLSQMSTGRIKLTLQKLSMDDSHFNESNQGDLVNIQSSNGGIFDETESLETPVLNYWYPVTRSESQAQRPRPITHDQAMNTSFCAHSLSVQTQPLQAEFHTNRVQQLSPMDSYLETVSASVMSAKLKENINELDRIMQRIRMVSN